MNGAVLTAPNGAMSTAILNFAAAEWSDHRVSQEYIWWIRHNQSFRVFSVSSLFCS